jgi:hypothetical protein
LKLSAMWYPLEVAEVAVAVAEAEEVVLDRP